MNDDIFVFFVMLMVKVKMVKKTKRDEKKNGL